MISVFVFGLRIGMSLTNDMNIKNRLKTPWCVDVLKNNDNCVRRKGNKLGGGGRQTRARKFLGEIRAGSPLVYIKMIKNLCEKWIIL